MKKIKLYLDTSTLGGIFDTEDTARVSAARNLLELIKNKTYEGFISYLTLLEIQRAPLKIKNELERLIADAGLSLIEETKECIELSEAYLHDKVIPVKYRDDARHIAIAVYHQIDYVVSWNYRHMANITVRRLINSVNLRLGFPPIDIVPPEEVTGYGEVEI